MPYSKPQVTIDLEEYQDLKSRPIETSPTASKEITDVFAVLLIVLLKKEDGKPIGDYIRTSLSSNGIALSGGVDGHVVKDVTYNLINERTQ